MKLKADSYLEKIRNKIVGYRDGFQQNPILLSITELRPCLLKFRTICGKRGNRQSGDRKELNAFFILDEEFSSFINFLFTSDTVRTYSSFLLFTTLDVKRKPRVKIQ